MPELLPSVGRIVHYVSHGTPPRGDGSQAYPSACRAAIVTQVTAPGSPDDGGFYVGPDTVGLAVLNPTGMFFHERVEFDAGLGQPASPMCGQPHEAGPFRYCACGWTEAAHRGGTWHWPERVGA